MVITDQAEFNRLYFASKPLRLRQPVSSDVAMELALKGFIVDLEINVYGWDPYLIMSQRQRFGYTWYPNILQPIPTIAPGVGVPALAPYDPLHPPPGSIKVSLDSVDYPPFDPPAPAPPPTSTKMVGPWSGRDNIYDVGHPAGPDGTSVEQDGVKYTFHSVATPFGHSAWYTRD